MVLNMMCRFRVMHRRMMFRFRTMIGGLRSMIFRLRSAIGGLMVSGFWCFILRLVIH